MKGFATIVAIAGSAYAQTTGDVPQSAESCLSHAVAATGCDITDTACLCEPVIASNTRADGNLCALTDRSARVAVRMRSVVNTSPGPRALLNNNIPCLQTTSPLPSKQSADNLTDNEARHTSINPSFLGTMNTSIATGASSLSIATNSTYASNTTGTVIRKPTAGQNFTARLPATAGAASLSSMDLTMFLLCALF